MTKSIKYIFLMLILPICSFAQCNNFYISGFGGGGYSNFNGLSQRGAVFFPRENGGTLDVNATGNPNNKAAWFGGVNAGYKFATWQFCTAGNPWCLTPAAEFEGYYLNSRLSGDVRNPTNRIPEHLFRDNFKMETGVLLLNSVLSFRSPRIFIEPYFGIGAGVAIISMRDADSFQLAPAEPDINHFNSSRSDSEWTFAAQAKAGLRFNVTKNVKIFAEYRYLYLSPTTYHLGFTQDPTHAPTSKWAVRFDSMNYNLANVGVEYSFDCNLC